MNKKKITTFISLGLLAAQTSTALAAPYTIKDRSGVVHQFELTDFADADKVKEFKDALGNSELDQVYIDLNEDGKAVSLLDAMSRPAGGSFNDFEKENQTVNLDEIVKSDLTKYNAALAAVVEADYTVESWTIYKAVVAANVVTDANTQAQVDAATKNITDAQVNLVKKVQVLKVESVSAINGTVTVTLSKDATEVPAGLVVLKDGVALDLAADKFAVADGKVVVTVPVVEATSEAQSIVYSVKLGDASAVAASAVVVDAAAAVVTTVEVAPVSVEENKTATPVVTVKDQFGNVITGQTVTYSVNNAVVTVAADGTITAGAYVADANTATLTATVGTVSGTATVNVTDDVTKPTIESVTVVDKNTIDVKFSEKLAEAGAETEANYTITRLSTAANEDPALAVLQSDGKTVRLSLTTALVNSPNGYSLTVDQSGTPDVQDLAGNAVNTDDEYIFTGVAGADSEAPQILSATYNSGTKLLTVTFNEPISDATFAATNIVFGGRTLTSSDVLGDLDNDNVAEITLSAASAAAVNLTNPTVVFNAVNGASLADAEGNEVSATSAVTLVTPPTLANVTATGSSFDETTRILTIAFNEPVTLVDAAQISLGGVALNATNDKVVPSTNGTATLQIQVSDATYLANYTATGNTVTLDVNPGAVKDNQETLNLDQTQATIAFNQDTVAPTITGATYNNVTNILTITLNEKLKTDVDAQWSINTTDNDGVIDLATATTGGDAGVAPAIANGNTIVATIDATDSATIEGWLAAGKTLKVYTTANTAVKDLAGNDVGTITLANGQTVALTDRIAPAIHSDAVTTLSAKKVALKFTEKLDATSANVAANYTLRDNQDATTVTATKAELQADGVTVFLTFENNLTVQVINNYTITVNDVMDANLNRIANNSTKIFTLGTVDTTAPVVASVDFNTVSNKNNDTIVVHFTEVGAGLDKASAENLANYTFKAADNTVISLAGATASLVGTDVTITLANGYNLQTGTDYKLNVANVKDKAENVMTAYTGSAVTATGDSTDVAISSVVGRTTATGDQVEITFSEAVVKADAETKANYVVETPNNTPIDNTNIKTIVYTETDSNSDGVLDTFVTTITYDAGTLDTSLAVDAANIKDLAGNAKAAGDVETAGTIVDGVAPKISSVTVTTAANVDTDTVVIVFDEAIVSTSAIIATNPINIVLKDSKGTAIDISAADAVLSGGDTLTITLDDGTDQLKTGETYTVEVNGVMDVAGNEVVETATDVAEGDVTAFTFATGNITATSSGSTIVIAAGEDLDATTITKADFEAYVTTDDFTTTTKLVIASVVYNAAADTITLNLASSLPVAGANNKVRVKLVDTANGIADLAGNIADDITVDHLIDSTDNVMGIQILNASGASFGTWDTFYMAYGPNLDTDGDGVAQGTGLNTTINGTPINFTAQDGDFDYALSSSGTSLDSNNFLSLINNHDGSFNIHVNESGSSMNGTYTVDVTGKSTGSVPTFSQQFVYTTVGNDVESVITAQDIDNSNSGVDRGDIEVIWDFMDSDVASQEIYVLPTGTSLDASSQTAITTINNGTTKTWTGNSSDTTDSAGGTLADGDYNVYIVLKDSSDNVVRTLSCKITLTAE